LRIAVATTMLAAMMRHLISACAVLVALAACGAADSGLGAAPDALVYYGSQSGRPTLDQGEGGGNPFASALIAALAEPDLPLARLGDALRQGTLDRSGGYQDADVAAAPSDLALWPVSAADPSGLRLALVIVVSDYSASDRAPSLPGAARDAQRVADALRGAGWRPRVVLDPDREEFLQTLADFSEDSRAAQAALVYTTGHGVETGGMVHLAMGDFPVAEGEAALAEHALTLAEIAAAPAASMVNLVFYAGCRDNPLAGAGESFTASPAAASPDAGR
jgi:hypothetical protein